MILSMCVCYMLIHYISNSSPCHAQYANAAVQRDKESIENFFIRYNNISSHEVDLVFVLDRSASVSHSAWQTVINFVRSLLEHFTVDNRNTRVAVVTYSTEPSVDINDLGETLENKCSLMQRIHKGLVNRPLRGYTATHDALVTARNILYDSRTDAKKAVFVLTDGKSNIGPPPVRASVELRSLHWKKDWNLEMNGPQLEVYALGVQNADMSELMSIASPLPNHTYHIPDFKTFRQLARSLHQDQQHESWVTLTDQTLCHALCSEHARCMCGTKSGDPLCTCKAGYEGNGQMCTACPKGFYKKDDYPGRCKPCPPHSTTTDGAATHEDQCQCIPRYHRQRPGDVCQLQKCPELPTIAHGIKLHVTGRVSDEHIAGELGCLNTIDSSCYYRCEQGHRLTGYPVLTCEADGTWTGQVPRCQIIDCGTLETHGQAIENGKELYPNNSTTYGSTVRVICNSGWRLLGDAVRRCTRNGVWSGTHAWCVEINCNSLSPVIRGQVTPSSCTERLQKLGQVCDVACDSGYQLHGNPQLTCTATGDWSHDYIGTCVDTEPPVITCPDDKVIPITQGNFTIVYWEDSPPRATDNSGQVRVKVKTLIESPARMVTGIHQIQYEAEDMTGNNISCTMNIHVVEKSVHVVFCPDNILLEEVRGTEEEVSWASPIFFDNRNRTLEYKCNKVSGSLFPIGKYSVYCTAVNHPRSAICTFSVELKRKTCDVPPAPKNGALACSMSTRWLQLCSVSCNSGYDFYNFPQTYYKCGLNGQWILRDGEFWPDCTDIHFSGSAFMQGQYEYFYYEGDCEAIKTQIMQMFYSLVQINSWDECGEHVCSIGEVIVTCGKDRKRRTPHNPIETVRRKRSNDIGHATVVSTTSEESQVTMETTFVTNTEASMNDVTTQGIHPTSNGGRKHVVVQFGVNVTSNSRTSPQRLTRTFRRLQRKLSMQIQNGDIAYRVLSNTCHEGHVLKLPRHSLIGICVACPKGKYHIGSRNTCEQCPIGTYQDQAGRTSCKSCPPRKSTIRRGSSRLSHCKERCQAGHYSATGFEPCFQCDKGSYQEGIGQTNCHRCPRNTTTSGHGAVNFQDCKDTCQSGTYNEVTGLQPCVPCPKGTFQPDVGMTSCNLCPDNMTTLEIGTKMIEDCEKVDFCSSGSTDKCNNRGTCVSLRDSFWCRCDTGYTGISCKIHISDCFSHPCSYNSTCIDLVHDYKCVCPPNYTGRHCEKMILPCESSPCANGGSCIELGGGQYRCYCTNNYQGSNCDKYDGCASLPCKHGDCRLQISGNYTCFCHEGFRGKNCQFVDFCKPNPCMNGAVCTQRPEGFRCSCSSGYTGQLCEKHLVDLCYGNPCGEHGQCYVSSGKEHCRCRPGYGGKVCRDNPPNGCQDGECLLPDFDLVFGQPSIMDYVMLHQVSFPTFRTVDITSLTLCLWLRTTDTANYGTPFSYGAHSTILQRDEADMFTLTDYGELKLFINGKSVLTTIAVNDGNWHHICVTWQSSGGMWNIYVNGSVASSGDNLASNSVIENNGYFVIGQEQDVIGGSFSIRESFVGEMSQLNMFDYVLSSEDINVLANHEACNKTFGNVIAWTDVIGEIQGNVEIRQRSQCLDVNECLFPNRHNCSEQRECKDVIGGYQCTSCVYGYRGDYCNQPINECDLNVCHNAASCTDGPLPHDFHCKCNHGFTGLFCDTSIDLCASSPCQNNGTCISISNGYRCVCPSFHSGINCQERGAKRLSYFSCTQNSCQNNGKCTHIAALGEDICVCSPGYEGFFCEVKVSWCQQQPCRNDATCVDDAAEGYKCLCGPSWKGRHCEIAYILDCSLSPCLNNGTCINEPNNIEGYRCQCPTSEGINWGPNCEKNLCESNPCNHNGTCVNVNEETYKCICEEHYVGERCQIDLSRTGISTVATDSPSSMEMSTEVEQSESSKTLELTSVTSPVLRLCDRLYCEHGGTCQQISEDRAWCICLIDFTGQDCSIYRKRMTKKYDVTLVIKKQYTFSYEDWVFKSAFGKMVKSLFLGMLQDDKIQVRSVRFRAGKNHNEMFATFQLIYTKYLDTNSPALTSKQIRQVIEDTVKSGYLGNMSVSKANFTFTTTADALKAGKTDHISNESTLSYLIGGVVILTVSLGAIITVLCIKMRKIRYSYRKTSSRLLHHLNNSNDMGLNLITNPVFDGITDRIPSHGEETSCSNMYAELGDMLDPYCVTSKADLREEGLLRRHSSAYSSKRSNKECNLDRWRSRQNSEFSDTLSDCSKKTNSPLDSPCVDSDNLNVNKNEFTQDTKKDTKELLPSFGKHGHIDNAELFLGARCEMWYENSDVSVLPNSDVPAELKMINISNITVSTESTNSIDTPPPSYATVIEEDKTIQQNAFERPKCATPSLCTLQSSSENNFLYDIPNTNIVKGTYSSVCDCHDLIVNPAVDTANFIYSSPIPEEDPEKVVYFTPLPPEEETNRPVKKFSFCDSDVSSYNSEMPVESPQEQRPVKDATYDCSSLNRKGNVSIMRKDSASQTDYVDMDNSLLLDKVVHWRRRKPLDNSVELQLLEPQEIDQSTDNNDKDDSDDDYVEPNHPFVKKTRSGVKVKRKDSASQTDYIDMNKKTTIRNLRRQSEKPVRPKHGEEEEPCRRKSMDDYLDALPNNQPEEKPTCSTLPRISRRKDLSRRQLPPLPNDSTI